MKQICKDLGIGTLLLTLISCYTQVFPPKENYAPGLSANEVLPITPYGYWDPWYDPLETDMYSYSYPTAYAAYLEGYSYPYFASSLGYYGYTGGLLAPSYNFGQYPIGPPTIAFPEEIGVIGRSFQRGRHLVPPEPPRSVAVKNKNNGRTPRIPQYATVGIQIKDALAIEPRQSTKKVLGANSQIGISINRQSTKLKVVIAKGPDSSTQNPVSLNSRSSSQKKISHQTKPQRVKRSSHRRR